MSEPFRDLDRLPRLQDEGDGIRSYVGVMLEATCSARKILLIDEPEAFLHPPQARRLGRLLAKSAEANRRQIIVATHSSDVLRGMLDASPKVEVCRLERKGNSNHAVLLSSEGIRQLWSKPLLRSVAALDGVFHQGVVVSESDADSRFYEGLLRQLEAQGEVEGPTDYYFIHGGGKGELVTLASAYRSLGVQTAVIADIDMLRNQTEFARILEALGGSFASISGLYNTTVSALSNRPPLKDTDTFLQDARSILAEIEAHKAVDGVHRRKLDELIKFAGDWSEAKKYGLLKLSGGAATSANRLLAECTALSGTLCIVEVRRSGCP